MQFLRQAVERNLRHYQRVERAHLRPHLSGGHVLIPPVEFAHIMTYNVHRCVGADGRADPRRIAEVIAACQSDMVALEELDVGRRWGGHRRVIREATAAL
jgi:hypothetical protein